MKYDQRIHITHGNLAIEAGMSSSALSGKVATGDCPPAVGSARNGRGPRFYCRTEALLWASMINPEKYRGETVPPSDINRMERDDYTPSPTLAANFARTAELYPHRLITPAGVGNGIDHGQNKRRFAI